MEFFLWKKPGNKRWNCFYYSKYGAFITGHSSQNFNMQSHFGFYPEIGYGQWDDDTASQALKCMCGLFVDIWFLY